MNNVIRLRPIASNYAQMSREQLLEAFQAWADEPGIDEIYTQDWMNRGLELLPAMYAVALTQGLRETLKDWYKLCLDLERVQGDDAS